MPKAAGAPNVACPKAGAKEEGAPKDGARPKLGGEEKVPEPNAAEPNPPDGCAAPNGEAAGAAGAGTWLCTLAGAVEECIPASS